MRAICKFVRRCQHQCWLFVGGRRVEQDFAFLCKSIEGNRKLIGKLRNEVTKLEMRLWELEEHTEEETLKMVASKCALWREATDALAEIYSDTELPE